MSLFKKKSESQFIEKATVKLSNEEIQEVIGGDHITLAYKTDTGKKRKHNEDNFLLLNFNSCSYLEAEYQMIASTRENGVLLMVTDGMGGAAAGDVASRMVRDTLSEWFSEHWCRKEVDIEEFPTILQGSIREANKKVHTLAKKNSKYSGMGATITAAALLDNHLYVAQVGDSRCYIKRDGDFLQVTRDQSLVNKLVESGNITKEEARHHIAKNVILQAVGVADKIEVGFYEMRLRSGDILLLCSDGLTDMVSDIDISRLIANGDNLQGSVDDLVDEANNNGGKDNITVILAKFVCNTEAAKIDDIPTTVKLKSRKRGNAPADDTSRYIVPPEETKD